MGLGPAEAIKPSDVQKGAEQQTASSGGFPWHAGTHEPDEGTVADCTQAHSLIVDIPAQYLLADRGYDTNAIVAEAEAQGMEPVIPPRSHRKEPRYYDRALYKLRHLVENSFLDFKQWRAIATRYAENEASFLAICQIRALAIWTRLF